MNIKIITGIKLFIVLFILGSIAALLGVSHTRMVKDDDATTGTEAAWWMGFISVILVFLYVLYIIVTAFFMTPFTKALKTVSAIITGQTDTGKLIKMKAQLTKENKLIDATLKKVAQSISA